MCETATFSHSVVMPFVVNFEKYGSSFFMCFYEVFHACRGEEHVAVSAARFLNGFDIDRIEPLLDRAGAFVGGQYALARRNHRLRGLDQRVCIHEKSSLVRCGGEVRDLREDADRRLPAIPEG